MPNKHHEAIDAPRGGDIHAWKSSTRLVVARGWPGYPVRVRPAWVLGAFLTSCGGGATARLPDQPLGGGAKLADEDRFVPSYGKQELSRALIAERGAEATSERQVRDLEALIASGATMAGSDRLRVALSDLAVRRRFMATLEACESQGQWCPPRLDDPAWNFDPDPDAGKPPPLDAPLRFDLESWRTVAGELHGRACACRTLGCVDSVEVALEVLEKRPMPVVQGDDAASLSVTRGRECLSRLRGKKPVTFLPIPSEN